jgi:hypothetical protein
MKDHFHVGKCEDRNQETEDSRLSLSLSLSKSVIGVLVTVYWLEGSRNRHSHASGNPGSKCDPLHRS